MLGTGLFPSLWRTWEEGGTCDWENVSAKVQAAAGLPDLALLQGQLQAAAEGLSV